MYGNCYQPKIKFRVDQRCLEIAINRNIVDYLKFGFLAIGIRTFVLKSSILIRKWGHRSRCTKTPTAGRAAIINERQKVLQLSISIRKGGPRSRGTKTTHGGEARHHRGDAKRIKMINLNETKGVEARRGRRGKGGGRGRREEGGREGDP